MLSFNEWIKDCQKQKREMQRKLEKHYENIQKEEAAAREKYRAQIRAELAEVKARRLLRPPPLPKSRRKHPLPSRRAAGPCVPALVPIHRPQPEAVYSDSDTTSGYDTDTSSDTSSFDLPEAGTSLNSATSDSREASPGADQRVDEAMDGPLDEPMDLVSAYVGDHGVLQSWYNH